MLDQKLRRGRKLEPIDHNERGLDTLREVSVPGGLAAPALVINLLRRIPAMARVHQATDSHEELANRSRGLLRDPLAHPQQHARAFMYCLTGEAEGDGFSFDRDQFLPDELIAKYIRLTTDRRGDERFDWSMPTSEFVVRAALDITSRTKGSEHDHTGDHITSYPAGIKLGDIAIDEETIGCPGSPVAYYLWSKGIHVVMAENLWEAA